MNSQDEISYRLGLARGFLKEAEEDFKLSRWRSCVDNSQLSVENSGKAILVIFGISPKTHDPAIHLSELVKSPDLPEDIKGKIKNIIPDVGTLGAEEHFMTDYGDETNYKLPWDLFTKKSALSALNSARVCVREAKIIIKTVNP